MQDIVGKFFAIIFGSTILFLMPVTIMALKQDNTAQTYINDAVVEFVDNARTSGKITADDYRHLTEKIDIIQARCNITMTHSSAYTVPGNVAATVVPDAVFSEHDFSKVSQDYNRDDITKRIFDSGTEENDYELKNGDYLKVVVYNEEPTLGSRLLGFFLASYAQNTIYTSYGGYVGNDIQ